VKKVRKAAAPVALPPLHRVMRLPPPLLHPKKAEPPQLLPARRGARLRTRPPQPLTTKKEEPRPKAKHPRIPILKRSRRPVLPLRLPAPQQARKVVAGAAKK